MSTAQKIKTALRVWREQGIRGELRVIQRKLDTRFRPDETHMVADLLHATETRGVMFDVGAHHGDSLAAFAQAGWKVFAFEPDPVNRRILQNTYGAQQQVHIDPRALSDHVQEGAAFYRSSESDGVSGLSAFLESHEAVDAVDVTTLAVFLEEQDKKIETIDFLKIDTEGFDLMVLKGVPWERRQPRVILCEFEDTKTLPLGYSFHMLAGYLLEKGYHLVVSEWKPIVHYGGMHAWKRFNIYPCTLHHHRAWGNIFAVQDVDLYLSLLQKCGLEIRLEEH